MIEKSEYYLSFQIGHQWYGVNVEDVIKVLHIVALTELPGVAKDVLGIMPLQEFVVPVVDLRIRFNLPNQSLRLDTPIIALHTAQGPIGLIVDDVDDVEEITETSNYGETESPFVKSVARLPDKLLLMLDTSRLHTSETLPESIAAVVEATQPKPKKAAPKRKPRTKKAAAKTE